MDPTGTLYNLFCIYHASRAQMILSRPRGPAAEVWAEEFTKIILCVREHIEKFYTVILWDCVDSNYVSLLAHLGICMGPDRSYLESILKKLVQSKVICLYRASYVANIKTSFL